jgi:hypothetical protein
VLVGAGLVLYLTAPSAGAGPAPSLGVGLGPSGAMMRGGF